MKKQLRFETLEDRRLLSADAFLLHSNPTANHTLFLDFDGAVTSNTVWNNYNGGQPIVTPAYDFDGNVNSFSAAELNRIHYIWERVAEDFMPFNINVTTQDPGASVLNQKGHKSVIIGGSSFDWWGSANAGVAYVASFNWSNVDVPAFVFEEQLGNGDEAWTAEAISHEAGHTLGLTHDGQWSTEYYAGHGSGETGWAPIMGASYYKNITQWSKGEYSGATNTQDDLLIISSYNGFSYRTDDHGGNNTNATQLTTIGNSVSGKGIIERNTDVDVFSFTTATGNVQLNVNPAARGANLDIRLDLYNSSGSLVSTSNNINVLSASLNLSLAGGEYFLHIRGDGSANYSNYGSLGQYTVNGTIVEAPVVTNLSIAALDADKAEGLPFVLTPYTFLVTRTGNASDTTTVDYLVSSTSADQWDFLGYWPSGTVTFAPGETSKVITIEVCGDDIIELDEEFTITLHNASANTNIVTSTAIGIIRNDDTPPPPPIPGGVTVVGADLITKEDGRSDTFTVALTTAPTSNVTISVNSSNTAEGVTSVAYLMFTPENWNVPQTVVVTGVDDNVVDGHCDYKIMLGTTQSNDPSYQGIVVPEVLAKNLDDDKGKGQGKGRGK